MTDMNQRDRTWTKPFWWFTGGALPALGADEYVVFDVGGWLEGGQSRWMGRIVLTNVRLMHLPMVDRVSVPVGRGWRDARTPTTIALAEIESVDPVIVPRGPISRSLTGNSRLRHAAVHASRAGVAE